MGLQIFIALAEKDFHIFLLMFIDILPRILDLLEINQ